MKLSQFFSELVTQAGNTDPEVIAAIGQIADTELPEAFNKLPINKLVHVDNAHAVAEVNQKVSKGLTQKQRTLITEQLRELGFSDEDIADLKDLRPEEYVAPVAKKIKSKVETLSAKDKTEREQQLEAELGETRKSLEKEKTNFAFKLMAMRSQQEEEALNKALAEYVRRLPLNNDILTETTRIDIACRRIKENAESYNAQVRLIDGELCLVDRDGSTTVMDGYRRVDFKEVTTSALEREGLLKKTKTQPTQGPAKVEKMGATRNKAHEKFLNSLNSK